MLADFLLDKPLSDYVREKRTGRPKWSWADIAAQLSDDTGSKVDVSGETLRLWFASDERSEASS
jgi:hypothetical protein